MQIKELIDLIDNVISLKTETTNIELKKASKGVPERLYDTFSSFSNTSGGIIIFGIDEKNNYEVCGINNPDTFQKNITEQALLMEPQIRPVITICKYKGKTISDVLDMTVEEALEFFENLPRIKNKIQTLYDVGLGYIKLGQPSTTLSGGEAQRVKLATELSKRATGKTLYILDEPTTGLHIADVHKLVDILQRLVDTGNTILVIEHNLDLIKTADNIIDLGPEGGENGGEIIAIGTPEQICKNEKSYTGKFLKKYLE